MTAGRDIKDHAHGENEQICSRPGGGETDQEITVQPLAQIRESLAESTVLQSEVAEGSWRSAAQLTQPERRRVLWIGTAP